MVLDALRSELERNMEIANTTRQLVREERDMLQGEVKQRLALHRFHTDVWDTIVNSGDLHVLDDAADEVTMCYMELKEVNELVDKFDAYGNPKLFAPLVHQSAEGYARDDLVDIIRQRYESIMDHLRDASTALSRVMDRRCPVCGERFESTTGMKSHVKQKEDEAHEDYAIDL